MAQVPAALGGRIARALCDAMMVAAAAAAAANVGVVGTSRIGDIWVPERGVELKNVNTDFTTVWYEDFE